MRKPLLSRPVHFAIAISVTLLTLFGSVLSARQVLGEDTSAPWKAKMHTLSGTFSELLVDLSSDQRFRDPANRTRIDKKVEQLVGLSQTLDGHTVSFPDADPTLKLMSGLLRSEIKFAANLMKNGNREHARTILKALPGYCIACHTRNGAQASPETPAVAGMDELTALDRAGFFAASRQFDRAQKEFRGLIKDPEVLANRRWEWEQAASTALNIAVRVRRDPDEAKEIVQQVSQHTQPGTFMNSYAKTWAKSIDEWKRETARPLKTSKQMFAEVQRLMKLAKNAQAYPVDRSGDVYYLRATALLHDLLKKNYSDPLYGEALLLTGISYEVLSPLRTNEVEHFYYEACIHQSAHQPVAMRCYERYENSIYLGYTGSSGIDVPEDVADRLRELRALAQPQPKKASRPGL